jgi:hypothetical protein
MSESAPKYRAYAFDPKTGRAAPVPNVMFDVKASRLAPLPPPPAESFIEFLERITCSSA